MGGLRIIFRSPLIREINRSFNEGEAVRCLHLITERIDSMIQRDLYKRRREMRIDALEDQETGFYREVDDNDEGRDILFYFFVVREIYMVFNEE